MLDIIWNVFSFVLALSILVAVHEWGHYYVAKLCHVKVLRFSIGFGKPIYQRITSSGMEFVIAAIPLGGYVRMLDGRVDTLRPEEFDVSFDHKPVLQRMAIVSAGPIVNFLFAIFALMMVGLLGSQSAKTIVGEIIPDSYAEKAGLSVRDEIKAVAGNEVDNWRDVSLEMATHTGEDEIRVLVKGQKGYTEEKILPINGWKIDPKSSDLFADLGFIPFSPPITNTLALVPKDGPAGAANIQVGDEIIKIDGTLMTNWRQIVGYIEQRPSQAVELEVIRLNENGSAENIEISLLLGTKPDDPNKGYMGVVPLREEWPSEYIVKTKLGPIDALIKGTEGTWRLMVKTTQMLGKLVTGDLSMKSLSGPISIAQGAGNHASYGLVAFLGFLALISVNLGIINLLPLPILDGGHLLYFTVEWITGKPVSEAVQEVGFKIGGVILILVMGTAIFNDILRNT
ncbi:RIP metalloprotease RseP [Glaciecola petra]|uniref:Zinc metalloprotease n=1 Tax=Glaciecola petra TaxID=3075602 RepID=A0ABU2ZM53_9ALTE|nr:RIP metalloprotease RseP [Aestuariibacter sp. P117]MDT0593702.1 RIP metalloprotease RseP [Aestuariibacter sp. P117]